MNHHAGVSPTVVLTASSRGGTHRTLSFHYTEAPDRIQIARTAAISDGPCVWTEAFLNAQTSTKDQIVEFVLMHGDKHAAVAFGILRPRSLRSTLQFPTYPRFFQDNRVFIEHFWNGICSYCRTRYVLFLHMNSFEALSPLTTLPPFGRITSMETRTEYLVDIPADSEEIFKAFSSNHRRNIRKGLARNPQFSISKGISGLPDHLTALGYTAQRRESREEGTVRIDESMLRTLASHDDTYLAQIHLDGVITSSFLIIQTPKRAFYFSGGTTREGMNSGMSHTLMWLVIQHLHDEGIRTLSLGGAASHGAKGLDRYKNGFAARSVDTNKYQFNLGSTAKRRVISSLRTIRQRPSSIPRIISGLLTRRDRWSVFLWPNEIAATMAEAPAGIRFRQLHQTDFEAILSGHEHFREQAMLYYRERGLAHAYGAFDENRLVHITWVYTGDQKSIPQATPLPLTEGVAELTNCFTLEEYRGLGIYPYVIQTIALKLQSDRIRHIYMKTEIDNYASQHGIMKAGFIPIGRLTHLWSPAFASWRGWRFWSRTQKMPGCDLR